MHRTVPALVVGTFDVQDITLLPDGDVARHVKVERALGTRHGHVLVLDGHLDT